MFVNGTNSCFITLKDHKPNFLNNSKVALLNPAKNGLVRISKCILDRINTSLRNAVEVNKTLARSLNGFKTSEINRNIIFLFYIKDFYPTITKDLLRKCLKFAEEKVQIFGEDKFKDFGLEIVAGSNLRILSYLGVTLNLNDDSFGPYHKPDDIIQYNKKESNHPPNLIKYLPASISNVFQTILRMK